MQKTLTLPRKNLSDSIIHSEAARRLLAFAALLILFIFFTIRSENFFQFNNMIGILLATAVNGVLAFGVTFVIITGGIDLSIGALVAFSAVMTGMFITKWELPVAVGVVGGIATGTAAGLVNGIIISWMRVPPFVATLGMMYVARGLALVLSELRPIYFNDTPEFRQIAMGTAASNFLINHRLELFLITLLAYVGWRIVHGRLTLNWNLVDLVFGLVLFLIAFLILFEDLDIVRKIIDRITDIPNAVWILLGAAIIASLLLSKTILGRYTFALGSNEEATRLSGVKVNIWKTIVYMVCGMYAGIGGVLMASRLNSAQPALGAGYELDAIAAVVIGGTALSGGSGSIMGTVIGAFVLSVLTNGLRIMSVPQEWQTVVTGAILVLVVYVDIIRRRD